MNNKRSLPGCLAAIVTIAIVTGFPVVGVAQEAELQKDGVVATGIKNLAIGGNTYDVSFTCLASHFDTYGVPPVFDFTDSTSAQTALEAIFGVLNADGAVEAVGCGTGTGEFNVTFEIAYRLEEIEIRPPPNGDPDVGTLEVPVLFACLGWRVSTDPELWTNLSGGDCNDGILFGSNAVAARFELIGSDGPANSPPVAEAGGPYSGTAGVAVKFDGTGSNDPDGTITQYRWEYGDGFRSRGPNNTTPEHAYAEPGTYNVTLRVTDEDGLQASDTASVTIGANSQPPVADAGGPYNGTAGAPLRFDGLGSTDPDGEVVRYKWNFGDGTRARRGKRPSHTYAASGKYTVTLTVMDDSGEKDTDTATADVAVGNQAPTANPGGPYQGAVGTAVQLDGRGSNDPDGSIANYRWDFGDGSPVKEGPRSRVPKHTYAAPGGYTVTLTVTDDKGAVDSIPTTATIVE